MRVNKYQTVISFEENHGVVLSAGPKLQELQKRLSGKLHIVNAPEGAPAEMPRALIQGSDTIVNIAFNRFDITTRPPSHVAGDFSATLNFARLRIEPILTTLLGAVSIRYEWTGIVSNLVFPVTKEKPIPAILAVTPAFDGLVNVDRAGRDLSSFQLQFGFNENGFFKNYNISGYETRNIRLPANVPAGKTLTIDAEQFPVVESGVQFTIDINNKPLSNKLGPIEDLKRIFAEQEEAFKKISPEGLFAGRIFK